MSTSNDVLDAARTCLLRDGGRKITLAEVAREAGVSRPTVYRRFPEISVVIRELLTRELARITVDKVAAMDDAADAAVAARSTHAGGSVGVLERTQGVLADTAAAFLDSVVDAVTAVAVEVSEDPLMDTLFRRQPEVVAPYVFTRLGTSQLGVLALLTARIERAQAVDAMRPGRPDQLAAMVLLMSQSAIQSRPMLDPILGSAWSTELRIALRGYLAHPTVINPSGTNPPGPDPSRTHPFGDLS